MARSSCAIGLSRFAGRGRYKACITAHPLIVRCYRWRVCHLAIAIPVCDDVGGVFFWAFFVGWRELFNVFDELSLLLSEHAEKLSPPVT